MLYHFLVHMNVLVHKNVQIQKQKYKQILIQKIIVLPTKKNITEETVSTVTSSTCPYPTSTIWWQTIEMKSRAIIGYSDGSICFVELTPNCPFIASTAIENGSIEKLIICRDNTMQNVTLLINTSLNEQFKLLLEKTCINYLYPGDLSPKDTENHLENWQIVVPLKTELQNAKTVDENDMILKEIESNKKLAESLASSIDESIEKGAGLLPAAKAKLTSLKNLGTKKLNAIKMKLSENRQRIAEADNIEKFTIVDSPQMVPELLSGITGPLFAAQLLRNTFLLSALRSKLNTLSIHSMDTSFLPLFLYKLPENCKEILIGSNVLYSINYGINNKQSNNKIELTIKEDEPENMENIDGLPQNISCTYDLNNVCVLSSSMASMKTGQNDSFNEKALLSKFSFENEKIINLHRKCKFQKFEAPETVENQPKNPPTIVENIKTSNDYINYYNNKHPDDEIFLEKVDIMKSDISKLNFDPCFIVTDQNVYFIDFKEEPLKIFLDSAITGNWNTCEEFCNTFDLNFSQCMEFVGDYLLDRKKVTQALVTYNVAKVPIIKTALKLALHRETYALMHLCAMALKVVYLLKSKYFNRRLFNALKPSLPCMHIEEIKFEQTKKRKTNIINEGISCGDYTYGVDEAITSLQMTASSQFHLSNLLLITLVEKTVKDKNTVPLWNFLISNSKFHTNMASIVLSQSGLYSSAVMLAMTKGSFLDVFIGLVNAANQEFGFYSELNVCLFNLTEPIFVECLTYLQRAAYDYFDIIENKITKILPNVLERLEQQLNPFSGIYRPLLCQPFTQNVEPGCGANNPELLSFCSHLVETYILVIINLLRNTKNYQSNVLNAFDSFNMIHETNQFAMNISNFSPLAVGCTHCTYVVDGIAYFWGTNGIPIVYDAANFTDLTEPAYTVKRLEILNKIEVNVYAIKCGRQHTLILTNNGIYSFGSNNLYQLGVGKSIILALQPMFVKDFDTKYISLIEAGQYHNAVVADNNLYTWGWGIYGQLGHGNVENIDKPKIVEFFRKKKILNVSLGHAHSMVLIGIGNSTELYMFGSNHFGQIGIGSSTLNKVLVPIKLEFNVNIRLIYTKFFTNLAVDNDNQLHTWGSSPQALRLANQMKRRSNSKHKIEETIKKEIDRRKLFSSDDSDCCDIRIEVPLFTKAREAISSRSPLKIRKRKEISIQIDEVKDNVLELFKTTENKNQPTTSIDSQEKLVEITNLNVEETAQNNKSENNKLENNKSENSLVVDDETKENQKIDVSKTVIDIESTENDVKPTVEIKSAEIKNSQETTSNEPLIISPDTEHLSPHLVDTSEVSGKILQLSCGLFHCALISSTNTLYTWGKNIEHQLGTEDRERKPVAKPTAIESIENPMYVHCGSDFTVVLTTDYTVKAFGGNANGQCGKDLNTDMNKPGRLFCLPTTKRLLRLDGNCSESPHEIPLPKPKIKFEKESIRYLKSIPIFNKKYMQRMVISKETSFYNIASFTGSEGISSSLDSSSLSDGEYSLSPCSEDISVQSDLNKDGIIESSHYNNYIHYCLSVLHGLYDAEKLFAMISKDFLEFKIRILMLNFKFLEAFKICLVDCSTAIKSIQIFEYFTKDTSIVPIKRQDMKFFIHSLLNHFIRNNFDLKICETFFLSDLDYYLSELTSVLFFSSDNYKLDENLTNQLKNLFLSDINEKPDYLFENSDIIFDSISVKFKTVVCKKVLSCLVH